MIFPYIFPYFLFIILIVATPVLALGNSDVLDDPVNLGAWIYTGRCTSCHLPYDKEHLAADYEDREELEKAIGSEGCNIAWSKRAGGELGRKEIEALARFMLLWEEEGQPQLPELPPFRDRVKNVAPPVKIAGKPAHEKEKETGLPDYVLRVLDKDQIAQGGYLYIQNCYRCHLTYRKSRIGRSASTENLLRVIKEGKTSTQMKPFSRMLGGDLKISEIEAIVAYILRWEEAGEDLAIADEIMKPPAKDPSDFKPMRLTRFSKVKGDREEGRKLYSEYCVSCHGEQGQGDIGPQLSVSQFNNRSDLFLRSLIKKGIAASLMKPMGQNNGGPMSAKEVDDLVAYLLHITTTNKNPSNTDNWMQNGKSE